jgi:hypothetical protein
LGSSNTRRELRNVSGYPHCRLCCVSGHLISHINRNWERLKLELHSISPEELHELLVSRQDVCLVDVRQPLDLVQIAAKGLTQYQVYLAESDHAPFGKLGPLAVLKTNPDGAGIVQTFGPLKTLATRGAGAADVPSRRFLMVTEQKDPSQVVLRQTRALSGP